MGKLYAFAATERGIQARQERKLVDAGTNLHSEVRKYQEMNRHAVSELERERETSRVLRDELERAHAANEKLRDEIVSLKGRLQYKVQTYVSVSDTIAACAESSGFRRDEIIGVGRCRELIEARFDLIVAVKWLRPDISLPMMGRLIGNRDHTSILHALNKRGFQDGKWIDSEPDIRNEKFRKWVYRASIENAVEE